MANLHVLEKKTAVDETAVKMLEEIIEEVRAGEIIGVSVVYLSNDACIGTGYSTGCLQDVFRTVGALEELKLRLLRGD